jgi:hypothetical protein
LDTTALSNTDTFQIFPNLESRSSGQQKQKDHPLPRDSGTEYVVINEDLSWRQSGLRMDYEFKLPVTLVGPPPRQGDQFGRKME